MHISRIPPEDEGLSIGTRKLVSLALVVTYIVSFLVIYINWGTVYSYLGLSYQPDFRLLAPVIAAILIYVAVNRFLITNIAAFIVEVQFFVILVPALMIVSIQSEVTPMRIATVACLFAAHLMLRALAAIDFDVEIAPPSDANASTYFYGVAGLSLVMIAYLVYNYLPYMQLVGLSDVYEQRFNTTESIQIPLGGYVIGFLQTAMSPILIARGIFTRNLLLIALGVGIAILIYSIMAAKIAIAQTLMTIGFGVIVYYYKKIEINFILMGLVALLLIVLVLLLVSNFDPQGLSLEMAGVIFMRSFAIQGAMTGVYLDFFSDSPHTFYSHLNVIDDLIEYPYNAPLGIVVGEYLIGTAGINANANFWVTDGIAAAGLPGIFAIAAVVGIFLATIKLVIPAHITPMAATASIPFIMSLGNSSFFTNLITGGGIVLFFVIRMTTPAKGFDPEPHPHKRPV
jgi:hypothetical protein